MGLDFMSKKKIVQSSLFCVLCFLLSASLVSAEETFSPCLRFGQLSAHLNANDPDSLLAAFEQSKTDIFQIYPPLPFVKQSLYDILLVHRNTNILCANELKVFSQE